MLAHAPFSIFSAALVIAILISTLCLPSQAFIGCKSPILYYISLCVSVCLSVFFSATAEPFALKFAMVFRNSAGKILNKFLGPMVA